MIKEKFVQKIKIDDLKIIKKIDWLSNLFIENSFLVSFKVRLLSFNSFQNVELNQTSVN